MFEEFNDFPFAIDNVEGDIKFVLFINGLLFILFISDLKLEELLLLPYFEYLFNSKFYFYYLFFILFSYNASKYGIFITQ
jgi:hypothetical protein